MDEFNKYRENKPNSYISITMLKFSSLSYWERDRYINNNDFIIIGAGIVGYSTAIELRTKYPSAKITILERGYLPSGASTKNAGFTCFGSPSELLDDLKVNRTQEIENLVARRYEGLQILISRCGVSNIDYQSLGSYELFQNNEKKELKEVVDNIKYLNNLVGSVTNDSETYTLEKNIFGFGKTEALIKNKFEGQIDTGRMMQRLYQIVIDSNISVLFGCAVKSWEDIENKVRIETNNGLIETNKLIIATNGLSQSILPNLDIQPARAQVLITKPIKDLPIKGTFHYEKGYYYFRNIHNRVLLGGGRNLDFEGESTTSFDQSTSIQKSLENLLSEVILPNTSFEIDHRWSGIMGVGKTKEPIVKKMSTNVSVGIRLGGMGVALGSLIGKEIVELH